MTIGFIDNDILLKLIAFQLFEEAIATLNLTPDSLRVLATAKFVFRQKRMQQQRYSDDIWAKAIVVAETYAPIPEPTPASLPAFLNELQQLEPFRNKIHEGETELILATRYTQGVLLLTGDKNCLQALPQIPSEIYARLQGRVLCLEQIILKLIDVLGFEMVRDRIQPATQYDKTIKICFGYSAPATKTQVQEALQSYINEIHALAPGLLIDIDLG